MGDNIVVDKLGEVDTWFIAGISLLAREALRDGAFMEKGREKERGQEDHSHDQTTGQVISAGNTSLFSVTVHAPDNNKSFCWIGHET